MNLFKINGQCYLLIYRRPARTFKIVFIMKTSFNINELVMQELKREATSRKCTMSELAGTALRLLFQSRKRRVDFPPLPTFESTGALVDIANHETLYQGIEDC